MRKLLMGLVALSGALLAAMTYERFFVEKTFGPAALLGIVVLACVFFSLLATLLLSRTRWRGAVQNAWLAVASVGLCYLFVDVVAGLILIQPLSPPLVPDQYRHHRLVPDTYSSFQQRDFNYIQRVNNLGLRGVDRPMEKAAGAYRILMLGDSFTMGKGVNDDETFSVLLERALNDKYAACSGRSLEVLNAGVDSYAPILSYIYLKRDLHRLNPDLVIENIDVSDLLQEAAYRKDAEFAGGGEPLAVPQLARDRMSLNERLRIWTNGHLYLTRLALFHINRMFGYNDLSVREVATQANFEVAAHTLESDAIDRTEQWEGLFDSVRRIKSFTDANQIDFLLTAYPWGHQVNDVEWTPGRLNYMPEGAKASDRSVNRIQQFAADNGVAFLNLFPDFRAYKGERPLYFDYDNHWTPAGHEVVAQGLARHLGQTTLRSWCVDAPAMSEALSSSTAVATPLAQ